MYLAILDQIPDKPNPAQPCPTITTQENQKPDAICSIQRNPDSIRTTIKTQR